MGHISSLIPLLLENSHSHPVLSNNRYVYRDFSHYYLHLKHSASHNYMQSYALYQSDSPRNTLNSYQNTQNDFPGLDAVPLKENTPRPVLILSFIESEKYIVPSQVPRLT